MDLRRHFHDLDVESLDVLDLGCGHNGTPVSSQVLTMPFRSLISVDIYRPYLNLLRTKSVAALHHKIVESDALNYVGKANPDSFDVTLLLDSLEHFRPRAARMLLGHIEMVTRTRIIIWLPIGECPQDSLDGNPYQVHGSTWSVEDLRGLGFVVDHLPGFHQHFHPPVDAAWAVKNL